MIDMRKLGRSTGILLIVSCLTVFPFGIEARAGGDLTLSGAISEALQHNPEIISAKRSYEAASARIWQAASLSDPMVELDYNKMVADRMLSGNPMKSYAITQDVPFPTKLYLRAKIASKMARVAYENYKSKEREIIARIKAAYAELFLAYRSIEIMRENKSILDQFSAVVTRRYSAAEASQADALKIRIELAKVDNELVMLEQKRLTAQARLNILMDKDPNEELGMPASEETISMNHTLADFYAASRQNNPELKAYRYGIERGKAAYDLSLNEFMPDFKVRYEQMVQGDKAVGNMWAGMIGATIPLWFFQKQAFGVKEMQSELEMFKAEYRAKENSVLFDIRDSFARLEANRRVIELYEMAFLPQAEETVKATQKSYESAIADFLTLLDSQRMLIDFKLDHYRAILDFRVALADLERAVGADLSSLDNTKGTK